MSDLVRIAKALERIAAAMERAQPERALAAEAARQERRMAQALKILKKFKEPTAADVGTTKAEMPHGLTAEGLRGVSVAGDVTLRWSPTANIASNSGWAGVAGYKQA